jgi:hypothetical protein
MLIQVPGTSSSLNKTLDESGQTHPAGRKFRRADWTRAVVSLFNNARKLFQGGEARQPENRKLPLPEQWVQSEKLVFCLCRPDVMLFHHQAKKD